MPYIPEIKVGNTTYNLKDKETNEKALIQRGFILSTDDINNVEFTKNGQWLLTADQSDPMPANWPSDRIGRLISFGNNNNNTAIRAQMVIDADSKVYIRYARSSGFAPWRKSTNIMVGEAYTTGPYNDVNTFPIDSIISVSNGRHTLISNFPTEYYSGGLVFTHQAGSNILQEIFFNNNQTSAWRIYDGETWGEWVYDGVVEIIFRCVRTSTGEPRTFTNPAFGLQYLMQNFSRWTKHYHGIIEIEEGIFDFGNRTLEYIENGELDNRGLFLPPYCSIRGAGKDKTKLVFNYTGTDETTMFYVSGLNVPYESTLEGFTLSVRNLRYTVHSDRGMEHMPGVTIPDQASLLRDTRITVRDVRLINEGFDDGKHGTDPSTGSPYVCPACWGSGSWNNTIQEFYNSEFIANKYTAWFNHNRANLTEPSKFIFDNCVFVNGSQINQNSTTNYSSLGMISWGSGVKNSVVVRDCFLNRAIRLNVVTTMGNEDAVIDYDLMVNTKVPVIEAKTNNAHLADNYITANCKTEFSSVNIAAYTPVSKEFVLENVHAYNSSDSIVGIAINSAQSGTKVNVQYSGLVFLELLKTGGFASGTNIGYNGTEWVEDNVHPIVKALNSVVGVIMTDNYPN